MSNPENPVIIVGSGPCGLLAAKLLLDSEHKVILLDIGANVFETSENKKSSRLKSIFGSIHPYDWNNTLGFKILSKNIEVHPSKGLFGYSTVWGATWDEYESLKTSEWRNAYKLAEKYIAFPTSLSVNQDNFCSCFEFNFKNNLNRDTLVFSTKLALNSIKCVSCGACQTGCTYNAIWTAKELFMECTQNKMFQYVSNFTVDSFSESGKFIEIISSSGEKITGRHLFLAAGPLSTGRILLKSNIAKKITITDTQICYMPLISVAKLTRHVGSFALSTHSARLKSSLGPIAYLQFYSHLNESLVRIASSYSKSLGRILHFILKVLNNRIRLCLVYFPSKISPRIVLELSDNDSNLCHISREGNFSLYKKFLSTIQLLPTLLRFKLLPVLFASKWGKTGSSYHLGSSTDVDISEEGFLANKSRVQILGSLALKEIEVGPITATLLAQTVLAVDNFLDKSVLDDAH